MLCTSDIPVHMDAKRVPTAVINLQTKNHIMIDKDINMDREAPFRISDELSLQALVLHVECPSGHVLLGQSALPR